MSLASFKFIGLEPTALTVIFHVLSAILTQLSDSNSRSFTTSSSTLLQIVLISVCMLCVGFIEEVIFRSFLMKALMHKNDKLAIFVSGSLFGIIHLLNIFTGNNVFSTLLQVFYAMSFGLMCAIFFYKTKNIIPCILCHGISNMFDTFLPSDQTIVMQYIGCVLFILISGCYSIYLWKNHSFENR
jgi:membrane protease YdiL (CAAX protease family)